MDTKTLISMEEYARRHKISRNTVYNRIKAGKLQSYKVLRRNGKLSSTYVEADLLSTK